MCELYAINSRRPVRANEHLRTFYRDSVQRPHGWGLSWRDGASVHLHKEDERLYLKAEYNMSGRFGESFNGKKPRVFLSDGDEFMGFTVIHTPGHTPGGISFYSKEDGVLFSGDTLFNRGYGRTDFPGGDFSVLRQSLKALFRITPKMVCYPGHDGPGLVGRDPVGE